MVKTSVQKTVLIAPLDWGLGHATRCLPIINLLLDQNYAVIVACTPTQEAIFNIFIDKIEVLHLFSYNISYTKKRWLLPFSIFLQIPKIGKKIYKEYKWLLQVIKEKNIDIIISDNRYGLYNSHILSVFITHQLTIKTPFSWLERVLQKINYSLINKFSQVWVPDVEGKNALAGVLSNPKKLPKIPVFYIGHLSRFFVENLGLNDDFSLNNISEVNVLIMLSGPEPQRSLLEEIICKQLHQLPQFQFVLLRGFPNKTEMELNLPNNTKAFNHQPQKNIKELITKADYIIARSGYTTIMEVLSLGKKCIFIPTPGQTEQEYLAVYLSKKQFCIFSKQNDFNLEASLQKAQNFNYQFSPTVNTNEAIIKALSQL